MVVEFLLMVIKIGKEEDVEVEFELCFFLGGFFKKLDKVIIMRCVNDIGVDFNDGIIMYEVKEIGKK